MPDIHSAIVEGLNKFVEMIVAPINARLDALERDTDVNTPAGHYTQAEVDKLLLEHRELCGQIMDQKMEAYMERRMDSMRDYVSDRIDTKFDDDLSNAVADTINGLNITAELNVRR